MQGAATQASIQTRVRSAFVELPFVTRCVLITCLGVHAVVAATGFHRLNAQLCLSAQAIAAQGQVYRFFTSALLHSSLLHLAMNMLALCSVAPRVERSLGSLQFAWLMLLICVLGDAAYTAVACLSSLLPFLAGIPSLDFMHQCAVGFSGVLFGLLLVDAHLHGGARSLFGAFTLPAKLYPWLLLVLWQLVPHVSFLGHLSGLLVGQLYVMQLLRWALPSSSTYQRIEHAAACTACLQSSCFVAHSGGGGTDTVLPVSSRGPGGDYQALGRGTGSPTSPNQASRWLPFMPFPSSSNRLADMFRSPSSSAALSQQAAAQQQASMPPPGVRLGGGHQPAQANLAAAQAAEARFARAGDGKSGSKSGAGGSKSGRSGSPDGSSGAGV
ncbi:hypothetical protein D9Q98_002764 [Chlorella vulgaris]|uniref:Peptidase S54 rhomboid domain-containing protein n=1 Tax=Chlorella vulgaris TaxID=3077 RepID=A0A9D4TU00_CHLVU|nr:hypothetical protein D9Q98_002764 [Chlorella vulgaris]